MTYPGASYIPGRGLPVAPPAAARRLTENAQVGAPPAELRGTNTPVAPSPEQSRPVSAKRLAALDTRMPPRDREVLVRVAEHRYLSTTQITEFVFTGHASVDSATRTARVVLTRLERLGLLRSLARRVGGYRAGSTAKIWQLAPAGARLLRDDGVTYRTYEPSPRFLLHCLAVADLHLSVRGLLASPDVQSVDVQTEPACWRRFVGRGGETVSLQPDLAAVISTPEYDDRWFVEVDLGTESLPTLLKKCARYEAYRASGIEQEQHAVFPLVLWLLLSDQRAARLRELVTRSSRLTPELHRFATPETVTDLLRGDTP